MSVPPCAITSLKAGISARRMLRLIFASTKSNTPLICDSTLAFPSNTSILSATPLISALWRVLSALHSSMSYATASAAPHFNAVMARIPVPQPQSSTLLPFRSISSNAPTIIWVVSCVPVPKALRAWIPMVMGDGCWVLGVGDGCKTSYITSLSPILIGAKPSSCSQVSFQSLSSTSSVSKVTLTPYIGKSIKASLTAGS